MRVRVRMAVRVWCVPKHTTCVYVSMGVILYMGLYMSVTVSMPVCVYVNQCGCEGVGVGVPVEAHQQINEVGRAVRGVYKSPRCRDDDVTRCHFIWPRLTPPRVLFYATPPAGGGGEREEEGGRRKRWFLVVKDEKEGMVVEEEEEEEGVRGKEGWKMCSRHKKEW